MSDLLQYKNYTATLEYDADAEIFFGRILHIDDSISFQGAGIAELKAAMRDAVEDYIETCRELGKQPGKPYSGTLSLRIPPELHKNASQAAVKQRKSLNEWIGDAMQKDLELPVSKISIEAYHKTISKFSETNNKLLLSTFSKQPICVEQNSPEQWHTKINRHELQTITDSWTALQRHLQ